MIGVVEVYKEVDGKLELIDSGNNLILDNLSEVFANAMTAHPTLSGTAASGILDASNYTLMAVSFSKSPYGYETNAHGDHSFTVSGREQATPMIFLPGTAGVSSYTPSGSLPSYPDPLDQMLEILPSSVNSLIREYGQNLNLIPYWSYVSSVSSIGASGALQIGCYPSGVTVPLRTTVALFDSVTSSFIVSAKLGGTATTQCVFNSTLRPMDWRGFLKRGRNNALQGFICSTTSIFPDGQIELEFRLGADDLNMATVYGGIHSIGVWTIDMERTMEYGALPPFDLNPITTNIEYKLAAKRVFNDNLGYSQDNGGTDGLSGSTGQLLIKWRLYL